MKIRVNHDQEIRFARHGFKPAHQFLEALHFALHLEPLFFGVLIGEGAGREIDPKLLQILNAPGR